MKKKSKKIKHAEFMFIWIIFCASFVSMLYSVYALMVAYHNIDLGQNLRWLNAEFDLNIYDEASDDNIYTGGEAYKMGVRQFRVFIWVAIASSFFFGMAIDTLLNHAYKNYVGGN